MSVAKVRNWKFDIVKLVAAFLVISIHVVRVNFVSNPSISSAIFSDILWAISVLAVPIFFMTSGFFAYRKNNPLFQIKKTIKRVASITAIALIAYFILNIVMFGWEPWIKALTSTNFFNFIMLNSPDIISPDNDVCWWLLALLYVLALYYVWIRLKWSKTTLIMVAVACYVITALFYTPYARVLDIANLGQVWKRNWFGVGLIFFSIGYFINCYQHKILRITRNKKLLLLGIGLGLYILEAIAFYANRDAFKGAGILFPLVMPIIIFAIGSLMVKMPEKNPPKIISILANWGARYGLYIYLSHIWIRNIGYYILSGGFEGIIFDRYYQMLIFYVCVSVASLLVSMAYYHIKPIIIHAVESQRVKNE